MTQLAHTGLTLIQHPHIAGGIREFQMAILERVDIRDNRRKNSLIPHHG